MKLKAVLDEKFLRRNFSMCARDLIGSMENVLYDYDETDSQYMQAKEYLSSPDVIARDVIDEGTTAIYDEGFCGWGPEVTEVLTKAYGQYSQETIKQWAIESVREWL